MGHVLGRVVENIGDNHLVQRHASLELVVLLLTRTGAVSENHIVVCLSADVASFRT